MNPPMQHLFEYLGGITSLLVVVLAAIAAVTRAAEKPKKYATLERTTVALRDELELLRDENARLQRKANRPANLGEAAVEIQEHFASLGAAATDAGDEVWSSLVELSVLRETISGACQQLQTALRHVQVQLATGIRVNEQSNDVQPPYLKRISSPHSSARDSNLQAADSIPNVNVIRLPEASDHGDIGQGVDGTSWKQAGLTT